MATSMTNFSPVNEFWLPYSGRNLKQLKTPYAVIIKKGINTSKRKGVTETPRTSSFVTILVCADSHFITSFFFRPVCCLGNVFSPRSH